MRPLALLLLFPVLAYAGETSVTFLSTKALDKKVDAVNRELEPKGENQSGYEVDYRSETIAGQVDTWINITLVKRTCKPTVTSYLKSGRIISVPDADSCFDRWDLSVKDSGVIQIMCYFKTRGQACIDSLAKELTTDVVRTMVSKGFDRVYVK